MWNELLDILPVEYVASLHTLEEEDDLYEHIIDIKIPNMLDLPNEIRDKFCVIQPNRLSGYIYFAAGKQPARIQDGIQHIGGIHERYTGKGWKFAFNWTCTSR